MADMCDRHAMLSIAGNLDFAMPRSMKAACGTRAKGYAITTALLAVAVPTTTAAAKAVGEVD